jgi:hypothetical protein
MHASSDDSLPHMLRGLLFALLSAFLPAASAAGTDFLPLVIFATGQSNIAVHQPFRWTPNVRAVRWNNEVRIDGGRGDEFVALDREQIDLSSKIASDLADAYPGRRVCLINVSFSNKSISHWLPGTKAPDIFQNIQLNLPTALKACGANRIDLAVWWQGEGDSARFNFDYPSDFEKMVDRLAAAKMGFSRDTPLLIYAIEAHAVSQINPKAEFINAILQNIAAADMHRRRFIFTSFLGLREGKTLDYWDHSNDGGHMTGLGYFAAGAMGAEAFLNIPPP